MIFLINLWFVYQFITLLLSVCAKAVCDINCASTVNLILQFWMETAIWHSNLTVILTVHQLSIWHCNFEWKQQFDTTIWHCNFEWKQQFDKAIWYYKLILKFREQLVAKYARNGMAAKFSLCIKGAGCKIYQTCMHHQQPA